MIFLYFTSGILFFFLAQIIRAVRWQILLPENTRYKKRQLLLFVSIGSLANTILPFRLGDLIRAMLLSRDLKEVRFSTSITSIIIERMTDAIAILIGILFYNLLHQLTPLPIMKWALFIPGVIISLWALVTYCNPFKKLIFWLSSAWNQVIQIGILDFFWCLSMQISYRRFLTWQYISTTILLWCSYLIAYYFFSLINNNLSTVEIFELFHSENLNGSITNAYTSGYNSKIILDLSVFLITPILFSILLTFKIGIPPNRNSARNFLNFFSSNFEFSRFGLPSSFSGNGAFRKFLYSYFSNNVDLLSKVGDRGFEDCKISRIFRGGSGAITAVIEKDEEVSIRKVVSISENNRLTDQYLWLQFAIKNQLPVTPCFNYVTREDFCYYEMPYLVGSMDMYEWIHAVPIKSSLSTFKDIVETVSNFHIRNIKDHQDMKALNLYLEEKVLLNINVIKEISSQLIDPYNFFINDVKFSLDEWSFLEDINFFRDAFRFCRQTNIHGDLTIDNMVIYGDNNWFLIDPNPTTLYKTALMDWGKLFQSLHSGYEFLDRGTRVTFNQTSIKYSSYRSDKYESLFQYLLSSLKEKYGEHGVKAALLHEIIHYLRLLPYKFRSNDEKGLLFFAITCIIIREFKARYELS